jgi:hypothetical protein
MASRSIWYQAIADLPAASGVTRVQFRVLRGGASVYTGIARKAPSEDFSIRVNITDIVADFLSHNFPSASGFNSEDSALDFIVQSAAIDSSSWETVAQFVIGDCWDYLTTDQTIVYDYPIARLPGWAWAPVSNVDTTSRTMRIYAYDGAGGTGTSSTRTHAGAAGTSWFDLASIGCKSFRPQSTAADPVDVIDCCNAVLYYVNAQGGWSAIPIEGAVVDGDALDRKTYGYLGYPSVGVWRDDMEIVTNVTKRFSLHTAPLTGAEAKALERSGLFRTPMAYLARYGETTLPVIITDTDFSYVRRGAGSAQMPVYEINVRVAQRRQAR